jgi:cell division protein FtsQ
MTEKRKISVRKILQVLLTLVVTVGCVIVMVSASRVEDRQTLKEVRVHIKNDKKYHFIEEKEITDLAINNRGLDILHIPLSRLDIHSMEQVVKKDPWVADAQVYVDNERVLHLYVTQRIPVARLFLQNGSSYYIDTTFNTMPLSDNSVYYTMVVTNVPELKNDSVGKSLKKQIVSLVRTIQADTFWNAQVAEVIIDSVNNFELTPVLGEQRILLGEAADIREKLDNLFAFYRRVLNRIGWDKYEVLDVRFKGQVVASPSLPYKGPVDKALATMNWVSSITETEAIMAERDSIRKAEAGATEKWSPVAHISKRDAARVKDLKIVDDSTRRGLRVAGSKAPESKKAATPVAAHPAKVAAPKAVVAPTPDKAAGKTTSVKKAVQLKSELHASAKKAAKPAAKKKAAAKAKPVKKETNNKNKKGNAHDASPKYVYPAKKGH